MIALSGVAAAVIQAGEDLFARARAAVSFVAGAPSTLRGRLVFPGALDGIDGRQGCRKIRMFLRAQVFPRRVAQDKSEVGRARSAHASHQLLVDQETFLVVLRSQLAH